MHKVIMGHATPWRRWIAGLLLSALPLHAQFCGNLTSYQIQSGAVHDVNQDGFPDFQLQVEQSRLVEYRGPQLGCVVLDAYWVRIVPLGGNELLTQSNGPTRDAVALAPGTSLRGIPGTGWGTAAGMVFFKGDPSLVSNAAEGAAGPLNAPVGGSALFGLRLVSHDGPRLAWIRLSAGPDVSISEMAAQSSAAEDLSAGVHPPNPVTPEVSSRPVDTDGDGVIDLFVLRRSVTEPQESAGETRVTTRVTLLDRLNGEVLVGPGRTEWPLDVYAAGLVDGALVRASAVAPREWKSTGLVRPLWVGVTSNAVPVASWGPVANPEGGFVALRRPGGVLAILGFNEHGDLMGVDSSKDTLIAAGVSTRIPPGETVVAREYLDLDRDGIADLLALTTSLLDATPGAQKSINTTLLHAFGMTRLGTTFRPGESGLPAIAPEGLQALWKTNGLRREIMNLSQVPPSQSVVVVPKDQYLPVYLATSTAYKTGWLNVDASTLPMKWRAGVAPAEGESLVAGQQTVRTPMTIGYRKEGAAWVVDLKWAEFSTPARLQSANQLEDAFQNASFIPALANRTTPSGDGWVDRHAVFPASAASRFYRVRY